MLSWIIFLFQIPHINPTLKKKDVAVLDVWDHVDDLVLPA